MDEWLLAYRDFSDVELAEEIAWLKTQIRNPFNAQTEGGRSYARSTAEMRTRLAAASDTMNGRSTESTFTRHGRADFSSVQP